MHTGARERENEKKSGERQQNLKECIKIIKPGAHGCAGQRSENTGNRQQKRRADGETLEAFTRVAQQHLGASEGDEHSCRRQPCQGPPFKVASSQLAIDGEVAKHCCGGKGSGDAQQGKCAARADFTEAEKDGEGACCEDGNLEHGYENGARGLQKCRG